MAIKKISIEEFIGLAKTNRVLDVRSSSEFNHGHFPGAYNLALFTDEERKIVGTAYKQQGRERAIKIGLDFYGVKMRRMVEEVEKLNSKNPSDVILIHCWRGGMRSEAIAWLLDLYGFKVCLLNGGYKKFRNFVLDTFSEPLQFKIISGSTGSGKTNLLDELSKLNESTIDLENIAHHKGSAFGAIDQLPQPSQEMFENILALKLRNNGNGFFWIEDESQRIGLVSIPPELWKQMQQSPVYFIDIPFEARLLKIEMEYGKFEKVKLTDATCRIQKRLGGLETKMTIKFIEEGNLLDGFRILLRYYDKCYRKSLTNRNKYNPVRNTVSCEDVDARRNAGLLLRSLNTEPENINI